MTRMTAPTLAGAGLALLLGASAAASPDDDGNRYGFGYELMTPEERAEHRERMHSFTTREEREAYRREHHQRMRQRAEERGVRLPDEPLPRGRGMGHGPQDGRGRGWHHE